MKRLLKRIALLHIMVSTCTGLFPQDIDSVHFSDLFSLALENNFSLIVARNTAEAAKINNSIGNAGFLPVLDVSANAGNSVVTSTQEFYDGRTRDARGAKNTSKNALVEINWIIFDGTKMFVTKEKFTELENEGQIEFQVKVEQIYMQLAAFYYDLMQEFKFKDVLTASLETSRNRIVLAQKK